MIDPKHLLLLQSLYHFDNQSIWATLKSYGHIVEKQNREEFFVFLSQTPRFRYDKSSRQPIKSGFFTKSEIDWARRSLEKTELGLEKNKRIKLLTYQDPLFPKEKLERLSEDAPVLLFYVGDPTIIFKKSVAIIGTRHPDPEYEYYASILADRFVKSGFTVIAGLAIGCDAAAHRASLVEPGHAVAILPNGLHTIYPAENKDLANAIYKNRGCLISEYPPGARTENWFFAKRDRLQACLSDFTIVIETGEKGGTMITAGYAVKLKKPLFAILPPSRNPNSEGNWFLIQSRLAKPIDMTNPSSYDQANIENIAEGQFSPMQLKLFQ